MRGPRRTGRAMSRLRVIPRPPMATQARRPAPNHLPPARWSTQTSAQRRVPVVADLAKRLGHSRRQDHGKERPSSSSGRTPCLGIATRDIACAEVITPGYRIILEANGVGLRVPHRRRVRGRCSSNSRPALEEAPCVVGARHDAAPTLRLVPFVHASIAARHEQCWQVRGVRRAPRRLRLGCRDAA